MEKRFIPLNKINFPAAQKSAPIVISGAFSFKSLQNGTVTCHTDLFSIDLGDMEGIHPLRQATMHPSTHQASRRYTVLRFGNMVARGLDQDDKTQNSGIFR